MPTIVAEQIQAKRIEIEQGINKLKEELENKKTELRELQKKCSHPSLIKIRSLRNNVDFCNDCGFEERYKDMDMDNSDDRMFRVLNS